MSLSFYIKTLTLRRVLVIIEMCLDTCLDIGVNIRSYEDNAVAANVFCLKTPRRPGLMLPQIEKYYINGSTAEELKWIRLRHSW